METVTLLTGRTVSVEEAQRILEVDPIVRRFGTWAVTTYGLECLTSRYAIPSDRIQEPWGRLLVGNGRAAERGHWVVAPDFSMALEFARTHFKPEPVPAVRVPQHRRSGLSARLRFMVMKRGQYRCQLCGKTANQGVQLDIDHKVSLAKGGSNDLENLWVLCHPCNSGKGIEPL